MRLLGKSYLLSVEQIVQCDTQSLGCNGGLPSWAFEYVEKAGGVAQESVYPYTSGNGVTGKCHSNAADYIVNVNGYSQIRQEAQMGTYLLSTGPLSVCVDASTWGSYKSGVMAARSCGNSINHAVQAVGVDTGASTPYWRIRNSWGTTWGENGFIRIEYGANACDITYQTTYVNNVVGK